MKKLYFMTAICSLMFFIAGCKEANVVTTTDNLTITGNETLPLRERIELEMQKDMNSIDNIVQGQFDER